MWSWRQCAAMITFRISWALSGIFRPSASSTLRTEVIACTVVQTPQMRCVKTQASRGSRPARIGSIPRHIVPLDHAFRIAPPSTSTSTRRCPSMRVMGSMVISLPMVHLASRRDGVLLRAADDWEELHEQDVDRDPDGAEAGREEQLGHGGEVVPARRRLVRRKVGVEAVERPAGAEQE